MRVVALDLSLTATGVADSALDAPYVISSPAKMRGAQRLHYLHRAIRQATAGADLVVREGYAFGARGRSVFDIGELGGVVRLAIYCANQPLVEVAPATLKTLATGKGNSPKEAVLVQAVNRLGYEGHDNNEADARWLLEMALQHYGLPGRASLPKTHLRALEKVTWPKRETLAA